MPRLRFVSAVQGVNTIELNEPIVTVGRVANNVVCIEDPNISKHHTLLVSEDDTYKIYDLHSVNGTWINGERITASKLKEGDAVRIGYLELKYEVAAPVIAPRPTLAPAISSKTATGPTVLSTRPKLGFKPVVAAVAAATTSEPPVTSPPPAPEPVKVVEREIIHIPEEKKIVPAAPVAPTKFKPFAREVPPTPAPTSESTSAEAPAPEAAPSATPHSHGLKRLGPPGPPKFKLKRE